MLLWREDLAKVESSKSTLLKKHEQYNKILEKLGGIRKTQRCPKDTPSDNKDTKGFYIANPRGEKPFPPILFNAEG
jgi:hypothetical protein